MSDRQTVTHIIPAEFFDSPQYVEFLAILAANGDEESLALRANFVLHFGVPAGACAEDTPKCQNSLGKAIRSLSPLGVNK